MIDIYQQALNGQQASTDNMVQAAASAIRSTGGSYQPFAPGTPTLGRLQLDETVRANDMDDKYRYKALKETGRATDLDNAYRMAALNETIRSNDLSNNYQNASLAEQIRMNNIKDTGTDVNQVMASAMGGVTAALSKGLTPDQVKKNVLSQSQSLAASGINPQSVLDFVDSVHAQNLAAEKERLDSRSFMPKMVDRVLPGSQYR